MECAFPHTVIVVIGGHAQLRQHVIADCLLDIATVDVQGEEHDAGPERNMPVKSVHEFLLLRLRPLQLRLEDVTTFVLVLLVDGTVVLGDFGVEEGVGVELLISEAWIV